jgi:hypothetical protein
MRCSFTTLLRVLTYCKAFQPDMVLFRAAWAWVISDVKHVAFLEEILKVGWPGHWAGLGDGHWAAGWPEPGCMPHIAAAHASRSALQGPSSSPTSSPHHLLPPPQVVKIPDITFQDLIRLGSSRELPGRINAGFGNDPLTSIAQLQQAATLQSTGGGGGLDLSALSRGGLPGAGPGADAAAMQMQMLQGGMGGPRCPAGQSLPWRPGPPLGRRGRLCGASAECLAVGPVRLRSCRAAQRRAPRPAGPCRRRAARSVPGVPGAAGRAGQQAGLGSAVRRHGGARGGRHGRPDAADWLWRRRRRLCDAAG